MSIDGLNDGQIRKVLTSTKRIALVGASNKPVRPSYGVMQYLLGRGFVVVPVNPGLAGQDLLGQRVVGTLQEAGELDMVDLFRNSAEVELPVIEAIRLGVKTIWMQLGVVNETAANAAREAGITVVMDRCPVIEMRRLGIE